MIREKIAEIIYHSESEYFNIGSVRVASCKTFLRKGTIRYAESRLS